MGGGLVCEERRGAQASRLCGRGDWLVKRSSLEPPGQFHTQAGRLCSLLFLLGEAESVRGHFLRLGGGEVGVGFGLGGDAAFLAPESKDIGADVVAVGPCHDAVIEVGFGEKILGPETGGEVGPGLAGEVVEIQFRSQSVVVEEGIKTVAVVADVEKARSHSRGAIVRGWR